MKESPFLETERLRLRKITIGDGGDIREMYANKEMFRFTDPELDLNTEPFAFEECDAAQMIVGWENDTDLLCWGIDLKSKQKLIGRVYLYDFIGNEIAGYRAELGYSVSMAYRGCGYAAEAVRRVTEYGFSALNIVRFQVPILPENTASVRVCEKAGFQNESILHKFAFFRHNGHCFKDIVMMAMTK